MGFIHMFSPIQILRHPGMLFQPYLRPTMTLVTLIVLGVLPQFSLCLG